jgi:DNA-binding SARP family transcriptional activator/predicted ATPase
VLGFHVLGTLEAVRDGTRVVLGGFRQRAVLAALIAHVNEIIPPAALIDLVWTDPPATADGTLYNYISRLRAAVDERSEHDWRFLQREDGGYVLRLDPERIDAERFTAGIKEARRRSAEGRRDEAVVAYRAALDEWRGRPYAGFDAEPFAAPVIAGLEELYIGASRELAEHELALGSVSGALERVHPLACERPLDGSIRMMHARALLAAGRPADAVRTLDEYRDRLADETGMDPGDDIEELRLSILRTQVAVIPHPTPVASAPQIGLVGREDELHRLRAALAPGSIVTVTGPAGVGKSTLARAALASTQRFGMPSYELVWDTTTMPQRTLVDQLGLESDPAADPVERVAEFLARRHGAVLLDGVENHRADALRLVEHLQSSGLSHIVLLTSREAIGHADEEVLLLQPLDRPAIDASDREVWDTPSAQVFLRRALHVRPDFQTSLDTSPAVARICRAVDGLPLALELAASSVDVQPIERVAARCEELSVIVGGEHGSEEAIRTALLFSFQRLSADERTMFRRLAIISGSFSMEAAQSVGGLGSDDAELLRGLIRASMVLSLPAVDGQPMFRILEPLRRFGRAELLGHEGPEGIELGYERLAAYFQAFAARAEPGLLGPDQRSWTAWTAAQLDALLDLLYHEGSADVRAASRHIVEDLWWAAPTWASLLRAATAVLDEGPDQGDAWTAFCSGFLALCRGDYDGAQTAFERALALSDARGRARVAAMIGLSSVARDLTRFEDARRWASEALDEATQQRLRWWIARSLYSLALVDTETGDVAKAERLLDEAREIYADIGDATSVTEADLTAMWALANDGQFESSLTRLSAYTATSGGVYDAENRAQIAALEAKDLLGLGRSESACRAAMRAVVGFWDLSQEFYVARCLELLGAAFARTDQPENALQMQIAADELRDRIGTPRNPSEGIVCAETMCIVAAELGDRMERVRRRFVGISLDDIIEGIRAGSQQSAEPSMPAVPSLATQP